MFPIDQSMLSADVSGYRYYRRILSNKQKKQSTSFAWVPSVEYRGPTPVCHAPDPCYPAYCGLLYAILASSATHLQSQPGVTWHHSARYFKGSKTNRKNDQSQPLPPYGRFRRSHPCPSVRGWGDLASNPARVPTAHCIAAQVVLFSWDARGLHIALRPAWGTRQVTSLSGLFALDMCVVDGSRTIAVTRHYVFCL